MQDENMKLVNSRHKTLYRDHQSQSLKHHQQIIYILQYKFDIKKGMSLSGDDWVHAP